MRVIIDTETRRLELEGGKDPRAVDLYSPEAFSCLSRLWLKVGWQLKYTYSFTWLGRPIIQLPEDLLRLQELVYRVRPDVLVETGVAHGGSLVFHASLFRALGRGRVIGVDIDIRPPARAAIAGHELAGLIDLVEGDSADPGTIEQVRSRIGAGDRVLVVLDSNHSRRHVGAELEGYAPLVAPDSYLVATDGIMEDLADVPRGRAEWREDNPRAAALDFAARHPEFVLEEPPFPFNEGSVIERVTHWPGAYLRRLR